MTLPWFVTSPPKRAGFKYETIERFDSSQFDGPFEDIVKAMNGKFDLWTSQGWTEIRISLDGWDVYALGWRPMTEREIATQKLRASKARVAAKQRKEKKEAEERAQYEKLKAKYDST
jgi:hypothetical protein